MTGVPQGYLSDLENGRRAVMAETMAMLAQAPGVRGLRGVCCTPYVCPLPADLQPPVRMSA